MHFTSQGKSLDMAYVYRKSMKAGGETVLLLHGKNFSSAYWENTMDFLLGHGYNVLAPDQIGFGKSTKATQYQYSFQQLAANTKKLLDTLNIEKVTVIGHSMGGMLAIRFALMYPSVCTRLILENPIGLEDWKLKVPYTTIDNEYKKELAQTRAKLKEYMTENYFHGVWKQDYEPLLDQSASYLNQKDFSAEAKCMALTSDMIFTQPVCYEFSAIKVPVALIIGQADHTAIGKDRVTPEQAASMGDYPVLGQKASEAIKGSRLLELDGIGHIPHIENFKSFSQNLLKELKI
jgi:pimeloyl-ACP methyl ester carboxylesterase